MLISIDLLSILNRCCDFLYLFIHRLFKIKMYQPISLCIFIVVAVSSLYMLYLCFIFRVLYIDHSCCGWFLLIMKSEAYWMRVRVHTSFDSNTAGVCKFIVFSKYLFFCYWTMNRITITHCQSFDSQTTGWEWKTQNCRALKLVISFLLAVFLSHSFFAHTQTQTTTELREEKKNQITIGVLLVFIRFLCYFPMHMDKIEYKTKTVFVCVFFFIVVLL